MSDAAILNSVVGRYIAAASDTERAALCDRFPEVLTGDVLESLRSALQALQEVVTASEDADTTFNSLMRNLGLHSPMARSPLAVSQEADQVDLVADAVTGSLIAQGEGSTGDGSSGAAAIHQSQELFGQMLRSLMAQVVVVDDDATEDVDRNEGANAAGDGCSVALHRSSQTSRLLFASGAPELFYHVMGFLTMDIVFEVCENVCTVWRARLFEGPEAQSFWLGSVFHTFPNEMAQLTTNGGACDALLDGDWRTIAMTLICAAEDEPDA